MDEVNEQHEISKEIADAIANPLGRLDSSFDDAELEKELEDLEQEELNKVLLHVDGIEIPGGPSEARANDKYENVDAVIPGTSAQSDKKAESKSDPDENKELEELAQWSNSF